MIEIIEDNKPPEIGNLPAAKPVYLNQAAQYQATANDVDRPENALAWSKANGACSFPVTLNSTTGLVEWTCGSSVETCSMDLTVTDNGIDPPNLRDTETLTLDCRFNYSPAFTTTIAPATAQEDILYNYEFTCSDFYDDPLTVSQTGADTCGGYLTILGNGAGRYTFRPWENRGGTQCVVGISCGDGVSLDEQSATVTIIEDSKPPHWTNEPHMNTVSVAFNEAHSGVIGKAADDDAPNSNPGDNGYLICVGVNNTCSFPVTVTGTGNGIVDCALSFTGGAAPEVCSVDVVVSDGSGNFIRENIPIRVSKVWYVRSEAPLGGNGLSWATAFRNIQDAVNAASSGDMIWIKEGQYIGSSSVAYMITMKEGVELFGGFKGTELFLNERENPLDHPAEILAWNMGLSGASNSRLDGVIVSGANALGIGMVNNSVVDLIIIGCKFVDNGVLNQSGAINIFSSTGIHIIDCIFEHNIKFGSGGAIYSSNSELTIAGCIFTKNGASNNGGGDRK